MKIGDYIIGKSSAYLHLDKEMYLGIIEKKVDYDRYSIKVLIHKNSSYINKTYLALINMVNNDFDFAIFK
jgi:hypothetical protein